MNTQPPNSSRCNIYRFCSCIRLCCSRQTLISTLQSEFSIYLISWIEFFITSRSQAVTIENNISSTTVVPNGVSHSSVLGTLLFILYVNDIESIFCESITFKLFADDLKLYRSLDTNFHHSHLQEAINSVVAWSVTWQLPINFPKCSSFHIGANNPLYIYYLNSLPFPVSNTPRDLDVNLDPIPCSD